LDEQERLFAAGNKEPLVQGSRATGQMVVNPLLNRAIALNLTLRELGDRYGRNPTARLRLLGRHAHAGGERPAPASIEDYGGVEALDLDDEPDYGQRTKGDYE
jgi:hypothetical protein